MICKNCGTTNETKAKFCLNCGSNLTSQVSNSEETVENTENLGDQPIQEAFNGDNNVENFEETETTDENLNEDFQDDFTETEDNTPVKDKSPKNKTLILGIIAGVLIISALSFFFITKIRDEKVKEEYILKSQELLGAFDDYSLVGYEEEVQSYETELSDINNVEDSKEAKEIYKNLSTLNDEILQSNIDEINGLVAETKANQSIWLNADELTHIATYETDIATKLAEGSISESRDILNEWVTLNDTVVSLTQENNLSVSVNEIDTTAYPNIKMYINILDDSGAVVDGITPELVRVLANTNADSAFSLQTLNTVNQLDQKESISINMVADVSDSMYGESLTNAKTVMTDFVDNLQFNVGDTVELTSFASGVKTEIPFTSDKNALLNTIYHFETYGLTAFYDALYAAVNRTAINNGPKYVVAFTDGMDNYSYNTPQDVIDLANRFNIPIYIISFGDANFGELSRIASSTNGVYKQISYISQMGDIYDQIYAHNKKVYAIDFTTTIPLADLNQIKIDVQTRGTGGSTVYDYTHETVYTANSNLSNGDDIDKLMIGYLTNFIPAMNNSDYSYIQPYILSGSSVEKQLKPYVLKDYQEQLLHVEINDKKYNASGNTCIVTTTETYEIQNNKEPLHMRVIQGKYEVQRQSNGEWKIVNFADKFKVISKINY